MPNNHSVITLLACGGIFFALVFFVIINAKNAERDYQINGIVNEVAFTEKGTPKFTIGGEVYFIKIPRRSFIKKIEVGDSIVKEKGFKSYKLIKKGSNEVILSD